MLVLNKYINNFNNNDNNPIPFTTPLPADDQPLEATESLCELGKRRLLFFFAVALPGDLLMIDSVIRPSWR